MQVKKILVTGGAGFIGSAVIRHIINDTECSVVNVDKLTYAGNLESLASVSDDVRYAFECIDICDAQEVKRVIEQHQPDIMMHLAAESHVDRSIDGPGEFIQTNIVGTYRKVHLPGHSEYDPDRAFQHLVELAGFIELLGRVEFILKAKGIEEAAQHGVVVMAKAFVFPKWIGNRCQGFLQMLCQFFLVWNIARHLAHAV